MYPSGLTEAHEQRFMEKVTTDQNGCWLWTAAIDRHGYGVFRAAGKAMRAHRVSFALAMGRWTDPEKVVMHACDNPPCVNPAHLSEGTMADNQGDMARKGRAAHQFKTHCKHGHALTDENRYPVKGGWSVCLTCKRNWIREYRRKQRAGKAA